jgi:hypothetical protein
MGVDIFRNVGPIAPFLCLHRKQWLAKKLAVLREYQINPRKIEKNPCK